MIFILYDTPIIALAAILGGKKAWWSMQEWSETKENSLSTASLDDLTLSKASKYLSQQLHDTWLEKYHYCSDIYGFILEKGLLLDKEKLQKRLWNNFWQFNCHIQV